MSLAFFRRAIGRSSVKLVVATVCVCSLSGGAFAGCNEDIEAYNTIADAFRSKNDRFAALAQGSVEKCAIAAELPGIIAQQRRSAAKIRSCIPDDPPPTDAEYALILDNSDFSHQAGCNMPGQENCAAMAQSATEKAEAMSKHFEALDHEKATDAESCAYGNELSAAAEKSFAELSAVLEKCKGYLEGDDQLAGFDHDDLKLTIRLVELDQKQAELAKLSCQR